MTNQRYDEILKPELFASPNSDSLPSPPGYITNSNSSVSKTTSNKISKKDSNEMKTLKSKKIWELASGPAKSVPMNAFMSYMTGNSLQMIPVTMTLMLLWNPIKSIFNDTNPLFSKLKSNDNFKEILIAKCVFILLQLLNMSIGVYKLYKMGLIPHTEADWLAWMDYKPSPQILYN
ncbi:uncharacterized protein KGF55_004966 [Candida pseudojiufengensis]|uniref:uncharacterized protein n=1 Tax=Candida pseudojiufengensis TaxID=497109 RepID=UPI002224D84A|nr:uncharacterized protein KGF55_004966 [Candida pseudojiufengensis]KAI5959734.1 hypothetical protein KGF55_004966 [Candida pseudojiufengensis]